MNEYKQPEVDAKSFTCPYCNTLSSIEWNWKGICKISSGKFILSDSTNIDVYISISTCNACGQYHIWYGDKMIIPEVSGIPMPNDDMPEAVKNVYMEAREVFPHSAKAAAALLRLAVQILCKELGEKGGNINTDIGNLVKKGLPVEIQQALDTIRVIGNNAVHPGTIDLDDNVERASLLFQLMNMIVDRMITQPNKISEMYSKLPVNSLKGIQDRDKTKI